MAKAVDRLRSAARAEGFDAVAITGAQALPLSSERLSTFIAEGYHGTMGWLAESADRRVDPRAMWPEARSVVLLAQNYASGLDPLERLTRPDCGIISVYALGRDYHDVVKGKLKRLAQTFAHETGEEVKVFVDTAPLMEKPLAQAAGLGWQGRHTNLVSRQLGSWFFIGAILTTAELQPGAPEADHCGTCRSCLDICPTAAFPAPYVLDARRCISYLTIEFHGHIPREFRKPMGNRIYGCDDCLAVCPWNKFAKPCNEARLTPRPELVAPTLRQLAGLDDVAFRKLFTASPVKRIGRNRFVRNVLIAIGNSGHVELADSALPHLEDPEPIIRAMAVWSLRQLLAPPDVMALKERYLPSERDAAVRAEWMDP